MDGELTVIEATRRLGITLDALYRLIYAGKLPARKEDGKWLIPTSSVEKRFVERNTKARTAA